jgi:hypothetical protein
MEAELACGLPYRSLITYHLSISRLLSPPPNDRPPRNEGLLKSEGFFVITSVITLTAGIHIELITDYTLRTVVVVGD